MEPKITGETSDGYHTFNELYEHRSALFLTLCVEIYDRAYVWRSRLHSDGSAIDGWFVLGIGVAPGEQITYHLPLSRWDDASFADELPQAPPFDGHTSADVLQRLGRWL